MSGPARSLRALAATAVIGLAVAAGPAGSAGAAHATTPAGAVLAGQTAAVDPGGTFDLALALDGLSPTATITVTIHDRVRSRSELASSTTGKGLRRALGSVSVPAASLPADAAGAHHVAVPLGPGSPAGSAVDAPGVYPVEVTASDGAPSPVSSFTTDLILRPPASAATVPLDVAVLAEVDAGPRDPAHPDVASAVIAQARGLVTAVAATPDVVTTLAVRPELLEALAASSSADAASLVTALQGVAAVQPVLALPYVATSPDGLADAGLATELPRLIDRGTAVLRKELGTAPRETTWLADAGLGGPGLSLLSALGVGHAIVDPGRVDPVADGVLTPARPFQLAPPRTSSRTGRPTTTTTLPGAAAKADETGVEALLTDTRLAARLAEHAPPALVAGRVLADLAVLAFEQPNTARAVVLPIPDSIDPGAVRQVLAGLRSPTLFHPVALDQAFTAAAPLRAGDGTPLRRTLRPGPAMSLPGSIPADVAALRGQRDSLQAMVGATSPVLATVDADLLRSMALGLTTAQRRAELDAGATGIQKLASGIQTPPSFTITLTARDGTVPLTIRNDTGGTATVLVHLHSPKLDLPGGSTIPVTITGPTTRLDIAVRTRASGSFPFTAEVTTPDGRVALSTTHYSVRSTAVSGVGLFLSIGAGLFLVVWWARHWREARRSAKLVSSTHPVVAGPRHRAAEPGKQPRK